MHDSLNGSRLLVTLEKRHAIFLYIVPQMGHQLFQRNVFVVFPDECIRQSFNPVRLNHDVLHMDRLKFLGAGNSRNKT